MLSKTDFLNCSKIEQDEEVSFSLSRALLKLGALS